MSLKGFVFCILYFLFAGFSGILTRVYVDTPGVMSTASLCFWVNVIIMPIAIAKILLKSGKGNSPGMKALWKDAKMIHPKYYLLLVVTVVFGNTLSLVGYEVVRMIGGTASSVISGSLSMIEAVLISVWIYKEGVSRQSLFSAALSVVAVVLSVL